MVAQQPIVRKISNIRVTTDYRETMIELLFGSLTYAILPAELSAKLMRRLRSAEAVAEFLTNDGNQAQLDMYIEVLRDIFGPYVLIGTDQLPDVDDSARARYKMVSDSLYYHWRI